MAELKPCLDLVLGAEGGYVFHNVPGDRGGDTYAGISRNNWPKWAGWKYLDKDKNVVLTELVEDFYRANFWNKIWGDYINKQSAAYLIFDFGMNAGFTRSNKICQRIVGAHVDGKFGPNTIMALNRYTNTPEKLELFLLKFSLERIYYYKDIAYKDKRRKYDTVKSNMKFLPGWINRVQNSLDNIFT